MTFLFDIYLFGSYYGYEWGTCGADAIRRLAGDDAEGFTAIECAGGA
jgi:hypothetical protein